MFALGEGRESVCGGDERGQCVGGEGREANVW